MVRVSFEFVNTISKITNLLNKFLVSFDVKSSFTNVPLDFTLKLTLDELFIDQSTKIFGMNRKQFKKLLDCTCKNGSLQFNTNFFYKQVDAVAMVSPLAAAIVDISMNWLLEVFKKTTATFIIFW